MTLPILYNLETVQLNHVNWNVICKMLCYIVFGFLCLLIINSHRKSYKQIQRIVVPRAATNLTLKKVQGQGQGHGMDPFERACHKDHACQIYIEYSLIIYH